MSKCELIELQDLSVNDPIELAALGTNPAPTALSSSGQLGYSHVVRLVGDRVSIESVLAEKTGLGHEFQTFRQTHPTWCDLCGEFIWGLYKQQSLRCCKCSYTCHYRCRPFIQLDCCTDGGPVTDKPGSPSDCFETDTNVDEHIEWGKKDLSHAEIHQKIIEYNSQTNNNLRMVIQQDGSYTGFIKVHFHLVRPISLPPPESLSTHQHHGQWDNRMRRRTSFYLPKDTAKHLHISSQTKVQEVIVALLNKFTVVDNPAKFALFERSERQNQVYVRKLSQDEQPLYLRLCAGPSEKVLSLVLKENETGDVNWDAFSFPELCNFLRILQREEEEYVRQIVKRYALARDKMMQAITKFKSLG
uniref:Ras association domain family member 1 n=1 Tax=Neogobius melanostomus TaxID=47308 RepID=A0A8C6TEU1_9GOBI